MNVGNLFDLYEQRENRFTFALMYILNHDRKLLGSFLRSLVGSKLSARQLRDATVGVQTAPTDRGQSGIPDGWIEWSFGQEERAALLVEAKIADQGVHDPQFKRHVGRLRRYERAALLLISPDSDPVKASRASLRAAEHVKIRTCMWSKIVEWASRQNASEASTLLLREFMEMIDMDEHLSRFNGFSFPKGYDYVRAKAMLRKFVDEVEPRATKFAIFAKLKGRRKAIKDDGGSVWDRIGLRPNHTKGIHLSFGLGQDAITIHLIIPNGAGGGTWSRFIDATRSRRWPEMMNALRLSGEWADVSLLQRHAYTGQKLEHDANIWFKWDVVQRPRSYKKRGMAKRAPSWWKAFRALTSQRKPSANWEASIGVGWSLDVRTAPTRRGFADDAMRAIAQFARLAALINSSS